MTLSADTKLHLVLVVVTLSLLGLCHLLESVPALPFKLSHNLWGHIVPLTIIVLAILPHV